MHQLHTTDMQGASLISQVLRIHGNVRGMKHSTKDSKAEIQSHKNANIVIQIFFFLLSEKKNINSWIKQKNIYI